MENPIGRRGPGNEHDSTFRSRSFRCRSNRRNNDRDKKWHMNQPPLRIRNSRNDSSDGKTSDEPRHNQHLLSEEQKLHQGEHLLARYIIREKGEMDLTEKVGSYGWELRAEAVASVWPDWP